MTVKSVTALVPVGELKPLSWFWCSSADCSCLYLGSDSYVKKCSKGKLVLLFIGREVRVQPLPDCDSFDWQPPREPTALELVKHLASWLQKNQCGTEIRSAVDKIIAAMEREAKQ